MRFVFESHSSLTHAACSTVLRVFPKRPPPLRPPKDTSRTSDFNRHTNKWRGSVVFRVRYRTREERPYGLRVLSPKRCDDGGRTRCCIVDDRDPDPDRTRVWLIFFPVIDTLHRLRYRFGFAIYSVILRSHDSDGKKHDENARTAPVRCL